MRWIPALAALVLLAGCGGSSGPTTVQADGLGITFQVPAGYHKVSDIKASQQVGNSAAVAGAALDDHNGVYALTFPLRRAVTASTFSQVKPQLDQAVSGLTGTKVSGKRVEFGGLPGYEYRVDLSTPKNGHSRLVYLFHDKSEYEINCQWTDKQDEIARGCDRALRTVKLG